MSGSHTMNRCSACRRAWRLAKTRCGTAATEFALTIPLLLLVALACADFGRIASFHLIVCNAARTGAETGATHKFTSYTRPTWEEGIRQAVLAEMQSIPDFDPGQMNYSLSTTVDGDGMARIAVSVSYPFRTAVVWPTLPSEVTLQKSMEFRQFR